MKQIKSQYKTGDFCYFFAHLPESKDSIELYFLCGGNITRLPIDSSPVYKITVIQVFPFTIFGHQEELARKLLNKKIFQKTNHLLELSSFFSSLIGQTILKNNKIKNQKDIEKLWIKK
jgi:dephospho-CoA kinase